MPDDIYCYAGSDVLKNKLNIRDKHELLKLEIELTSERMLGLQLNPISGRFDFKHLCSIHRYIFQDLFDWAGKPRTVNIGKGNLFCLPQYIQSYASDVFSRYYKNCCTAKGNPEQFVHVLAKHYADLNALHPFREGNGRAQREFAREVCYQCGYVFNLTTTRHEKMLDASIRSFTGDNSALEQIFRNAIKPIGDYRSNN